MTKKRELPKISFNHYAGRLKTKRMFGGLTVCKVNGQPAGLALCSDSDDFNYVEGEKIALTRALCQMNYDKEVRTAVWETYWEQIYNYEQAAREPAVEEVGAA